MEWIQNRRQVFEYLISFSQRIADRDLVSLNIFGQLDLLFETFTLVEFLLQLISLQIDRRPGVVHPQKNLVILVFDPEGLQFTSVLIQGVMLFVERGLLAVLR